MKKYKIFKKIIGGHYEKLSILDEIPIGASFMRVYTGFYDCNAVIIKMCYKNESSIAQILQNDDNLYVVKLFNIYDYCAIKYFDTKDIIEEFEKTTNNYIIIEKLQPLKLYLDYTYKPIRLYPYILHEFNLQYNTEHIEIIRIYITKDLINTLIKCTSIIQYLHSKKIFHGDLKQENMGTDENGNFKIFDFGESKIYDFGESKINRGESKINRGQYEQHPFQNDILALGKLLINILTNRNVFVVGRHYRYDRDPLLERHFTILFEKLVINNCAITEFLKRMLNINIKEYDDTILNLLLCYLKSLVN
jgi:serine/threonine protein kinase